MGRRTWKQVRVRGKCETHGSTWVTRHAHTCYRCKNSRVARLPRYGRAGQLLLAFHQAPLGPLSKLLGQLGEQVSLAQALLQRLQAIQETARQLGGKPHVSH